MRVTSSQGPGLARPRTAVQLHRFVGVGAEGRIDGTRLSASARLRLTSGCEVLAECIELYDAGYDGSRCLLAGQLSWIVLG
jgi:hypothetical protein